MRIWHQSFTDLTVMPLYRKTLTDHAATVMGTDAAVSVHGLRPGTYSAGCAPIDAIKHRYVASVLELQICDAALVAARDGFDAVAIGCFFDPGLRAARSLVDIPVLGLVGSFVVLWLRNDIRAVISMIGGGDVHAVDGVFLATIPAHVEPRDVALTCCISIALSLFAAVVPAYFASRLDPATALRD